MAELLNFFPTELCNIIRQYADDLLFNSIKCIYETKINRANKNDNLLCTFVDNIFYTIITSNYSVHLEEFNIKNNEIKKIYKHEYDHFINPAISYCVNDFVYVVHELTYVYCTELRYFYTNDYLQLYYSTIVSVYATGNTIEIYYQQQKPNNIKLTGIFKKYNIEYIEICTASQTNTLLITRLNNYMITTSYNNGYIYQTITDQVNYHEKNLINDYEYTTRQFCGEEEQSITYVSEREIHIKREKDIAILDKSSKQFKYAVDIHLSTVPFGKECYKYNFVSNILNDTYVLIKIFTVSLR